MMIWKSSVGSRVMRALAAALVCTLFLTELCRAEGGPEARRFAVEGYVVQSRLAVPTNDFTALLSKFTGTNVGRATLGEAALALQSEYRKCGFSSVIIAVSPQEISNRVAILHVAQGAAPQVLIAGQRYVPTANETAVVRKTVAPKNASTNNVAASIRTALAKAAVVPPAAELPPHPRFYLDKPASPAALARAHAEMQREMIAAERRA
ncbi:MAG TPA: POTRA domain-containing protein, partial [Candidatus Paceibacterota bacterium]|nr:POTRA domain-containing protein [Candidatus Paceibacterota bacterium]